MGYLFVGVDVGKRHHHIAVVDEHGAVIASQRVPNDQVRLQVAIREICHRRRNIRWAVDINSGPAALLIALLQARAVDVRYINGTCSPTSLRRSTVSNARPTPATPWSSPRRYVPATACPRSPGATPPRRSYMC